MRQKNTEREAGPEAIGEIVQRLFTARGWGRKQERLQLESVWSELARDYRDSTKVAGLKRGILEIEVRSSIVLQELMQFQKKKLLSGLQQQLPDRKIKDLRFRLGVF